MRSIRFLLPLFDGLSAALAAVLRCTAKPCSPMARWWRLSRLRASVRGHVPVTTQFDGRVDGEGILDLVIGERCRFGRGVYLETSERGKIRIGANVRINAGTFIVSYSEVSIGRNCLIGEYVSIRDADHGTAPDLPIREQPHETRPIRIGEDVWIGRGAVVLKRVTIGDGAVIAANSLVTKDFRPLMIVAGAPAREIRQRGSDPQKAAAGEGGPAAGAP